MSLDRVRVWHCRVLGFGQVSKLWKKKKSQIFLGKKLNFFKLSNNLLILKKDTCVLSKKQKAYHKGIFVTYSIFTRNSAGSIAVFFSGNRFFHFWSPIADHFFIFVVISTMVSNCILNVGFTNFRCSCRSCCSADICLKKYCIKL